MAALHAVATSCVPPVGEVPVGDGLAGGEFLGDELSDDFRKTPCHLVCDKILFGVEVRVWYHNYRSSSAKWKEGL